tara:strand:+ start:297 stop:794 length:498 start_codon:yes stop_codon:yes gene_type:complete
MIENGASMDRQKRFVQDAVTANRKFYKQILNEVSLINRELVSNIELPRLTRRCSSVNVMPAEADRILSLRGSVEFWYQAVRLKTAELKRILSDCELRKVKELKASALLSGDVTSILGVSISVLNALDKSGALPHRFSKRMDIRGNLVSVRCWLLFEVASYKENKQ